MRNSKFTYKILLASVFLVLMTIGIYIGWQFSKSKEKSNDNYETESVNTRQVTVYDENSKNNLTDVEIVHVDIYEECNHTVQDKVIEYGSVFSEVEKVENIKAQKDGYKLIKDTDGILMYERQVLAKCPEHYLIKLEEGKVVIYNVKKDGKYGIFEETEIYETSLRETYITKLKTGIEANTTEELYMILEDMES